jgi:hypothetical protein
VAFGKCRENGRMGLSLDGERSVWGATSLSGVKAARLRFTGSGSVAF